MTFREKTVVAILLLVARMLSDDAVWADEIKKLATHIAVHREPVLPAKEER